MSFFFGKMLILMVFLIVISELPYCSLSHIGYSLEEQRNWFKLSENYEKCAYGRYQTPVHIDYHFVENVVMPALEFKGYHNFLTPPLILLNNGHTVKLGIGNYADHGIYSAPEVSGAFLTSSYILESLHFHWGQKNSNGSEHVLNSVRYPMEMHLVHRNKKYNTTADALNHKDGLVVLAFFFQLRVADNNKYKPIMKALRYVKKTHASFELDRSFALMTILPRELDQFFTYEGSLTTPPCSEAVSWFVFPEPIPISFRQMEHFRSLDIIDNFRELKELGQRKIYVRQNARFIEPGFETYDRRNITKRSFWLN